LVNSDVTKSSSGTPALHHLRASPSAAPPTVTLSQLRAVVHRYWLHAESRARNEDMTELPSEVHGPERRSGPFCLCKQVSGLTVGSIGVPICGEKSQGVEQGVEKTGDSLSRYLFGPSCFFPNCLPGPTNNLISLMWPDFRREDRLALKRGGRGRKVIDKGRHGTGNPCPQNRTDQPTGTRTESANGYSFSS
jgi:hypothetical protein